jgi:RNA polymerase sigma-70 factor (ECF subfamily)
VSRPRVALRSARRRPQTETGDVDGLVALLADDVLLTMPPIPLEYQGRELVAEFLTAVVFQPGTIFRLVAARANGQPAFGMYLREPPATVAHANGVMVFTLAGSGICAMTRFGTSVLPRFGLPPSLPG